MASSPWCLRTATIQIQMFVNAKLQVETADGRNCVLLEPLVFRMANGLVLRAPAGSATDGVSTPRFIWNVIPPFGKTWFAGIIHDAAYRNTLEAQTAGGHWILAKFDQLQADNLMLEALIAQGVDDVERQTIYDALREVGGLAFAADRAVPATEGARS